MYVQWFSSFQERHLFITSCLYLTFKSVFSCRLSVEPVSHFRAAIQPVLSDKSLYRCN